MSEGRKGGHQSPARRDCGNQTHCIRKQSPPLCIQKSTRSQEGETDCTLRKLTDFETGRIHPLPSPETSDRHGGEAPQNLPSLPPAGNSKELGQTSSQDFRCDEIEPPQFRTEHCTGRELGLKRKRPGEADAGVSSSLQDQSTQKRTRVSQTDKAAKDTERPKGIDDENCHPVDHWVETGSWPESFFEDQKMSERSPKKRSRSTSYTQSLKDGDNPRAYTPKYEEVLERAGIFMDAYQGQVAISDTCQQLCSDLLSAEYEAPENSLFQGDRFWTALRRARTRNERRVFRDITPLIVPSAELLYIHGDRHLEHLTEEVDAVWTKCITLAGPQPKPDFAIGLMPSAFTEKEILKLKTHTTPNKATLFTDNMYFPFLMCEAKCADQAINRADRQNAHSASIAVNAIVQLYRAITPPDGSDDRNRPTPRVEELENKILAFSISHDHNMVKIYGHFTSTQGDKTTFLRHPIRSFDFTELNGKGRWIAYNFTRKVYDTFAAMHLERIRTALAQLPDPSSESSTSGIRVDAGAESGDSQEIVASAPSSEDTANFKKPSLPQTVKMQQENDKLRNQIDLLLRQQQEQMRQHQEQMRQQQEQTRHHQEQMRQQQEQSREQMEQYKEIIKMLREKEGG